jgi:hypothetical protein
VHARQKNTSTKTNADNAFKSLQEALSQYECALEVVRTVGATRSPNVFEECMYR